MVVSTATGGVLTCADTGSGERLRLEGGSGIGRIGTDSNHDLVFITNGTSNERMRIDSSGRIGIQGTPNSSNFGAKLQVRESGQAATTLTALFGANENASGTTGGISDNTNKACRIGLPHYDTDQKAAAMFVGYAGNGLNQ